MIAYWKNYPNIEKKLETVRSLIKEQMNIHNKSINNFLVDFSTSGGKYLRPALLLMFSEIGSKNEKNELQILNLAASIEILHMATLIHDDIIDNSPLRRGKKSLQSRYGKNVAICAGDLLFTTFFDLIVKNMAGSPYLEINARCMKRLLTGELKQMYCRYDQEKTVEDYLRIIKGKTTELFWLACREGAHFGKTSLKVEKISGRIGRYIGFAFQIYDDIFDLTSNKLALKKSSLQDLNQGIYTLPLILAKKENPSAFTPYLKKKEKINLQELEKVTELIKSYQGLEKAKEIAHKFTKKALLNIKLLPKCESRNHIEKVTSSLLERTY